MNPTISAIVVNYNAGSLLRACIDSLLNCSAEVEVIVVDNASSDGSLNALRGLPRVQVIRNAENRGFAAACNQGVVMARAEYLLFLNPDCTLAPGALMELLVHFRADPTVGMAGGLLMNSDGTEQGGGRRAVPTPWRSFVRAFGLSQLSGLWPNLFFDFHLHQQPLPERPIEVEAISGACMMLRREVLAQVGPWDEEYFLHCEDLDLCMRMRRGGWTVLFVPTALIFHALGVCSKDRPIFVEWHKHKGMIRFYRKFFRHQYPGVLMWLVSAGVWFRFGMVSSYRSLRLLTQHSIRCLQNWRGWKLGHDRRAQEGRESIERRAVPGIGTPCISGVSPGGGAQITLSVVHKQSLSGRVALLGATSFVGACLIKPLLDTGWAVSAYSRKPHARDDQIDWQILPSLAGPLEDTAPDPVNAWVSVAPIWTLPQYFPMIEASAPRRIVVLSSTSRFTKSDSSDPEEQENARSLVECEAALKAWAEGCNIEWVILRPTLIYGLGRNKNIVEIARFIRSFRFFPLFGMAQGLRQPVHATDVASACVAALTASKTANRAYNISGAEVLSYREMVTRVFAALGCRPRFLTVPLPLFRIAVNCLRLFPRYRSWSASMAERMSRDLVFDHSEASRDFGYAPRAFVIDADDL